MGPAERRSAIMKFLCRRKFDTIKNIAFEFGVSERTIRRDIETLSLTEPIYTQSGRYGGGVYVLDGYAVDEIYISDKETEILCKLQYIAENHKKCILTKSELETFKNIITKYSKPKL